MSPFAPLARPSAAADAVGASAPASAHDSGSPDDGPLDLAVVYRLHADAVAGWTRRLIGPGLDVEDIVHEVFLVVQRRLPEWQGRAKVTTWLYEITVRVVQARRRRLKLRRLLSWPDGQRADAGDRQAAEIPSDDPGPLGLLERREANDLVYRLLDGIAEKYRTVLILFELEGLSGHEIAAITGTSLANVWVRLFRGREKLLLRYLAWEAKAGR